MKKTFFILCLVLCNLCYPRISISYHGLNAAQTLQTFSPGFFQNKEGLINDSMTSSQEEIPSPKVKISPKVNVSTENRISTKEKSWFYQPKKDGTPSGEPTEVLDLLRKNSAYYLGDSSAKNIYLTFDEGYENGFTGRILDILKENNVKAAFFVTNPYINTSVDLVKRMVAEGHLVCNHSTHHPSMATIINREDFADELLVVQNNFESLTGTKMPRFFRPPMGKYSELSLKYTEELGYKTIFWSFAYVDWKRDRQPSAQHGKKMIMSRTHPGGIFLLHASSKTNTEILDTVIKEWKNQGYVFKSLYELSPIIKN